MIDIISTLVLLALGFVFGRTLEARHYRSIRARESALQHIPVVTAKTPDQSLQPEHTVLVAGSVVISVDYFKRFLAMLRVLVGGPVVSYETLLDRARREAILRMKLQAREMNGSIIFNVKLETASISKGSNDRLGSVEVLAYGTALINAIPQS